MTKQMPKHAPQWLGLGNNPLYYMDLIDRVGTEGWLIREHVIFPTLFTAMRARLGTSRAPIVDFGAGPGSLTERLTRTLGRPVEGLDASRPFVRLARASYPHIPFGYTKGTAPVGSGMHHAQAHLVLHCTPEPERLLADMARTMEFNGYAFITVPNAAYFKAAAVRKNPGQKAYDVHIGGKARMTYYPISLKGYETLFAQAGLTVVEKHLCTAPQDAPPALDKYKHEPRFVVYVLQKREDNIDTALIMHADTGRVLLLTRSDRDDKFPGAKSLFSIRRAGPKTDAVQNLTLGLGQRLGIRPEYINPEPLGSLRVTHHHAAGLQHANVRLFAVKVRGAMPQIVNRHYMAGQMVTPGAIRPFGGACTQLAHAYFRAQP